MARPVVLVHGAFHGAWCWERVTPHLDRAGVPWVAVDLPSCAEAATGAGLDHDVLLVEQTLDELAGDEPAVLCGHSRGGLVLTEAGTHPRVGHLVYLAALMADDGEDIASIVGGRQFFERLDRGADGSFSARAEDAPGLFFNSCSADDAAWAIDRLRSQTMASPMPSPSRVAWKQVPSTYVVCSRDQAMDPKGQRGMAERATATLEWDTDHSPFLGQPELMASLLVGLSVG